MTPRRRLGVASLGFYRRPWLRKILAAAGWDVVPGCAGRLDAIGVWGARPVSQRGHWLAKSRGLPVLTIEEAFLRSYRRDQSEPPLGLILDPIGLTTATAAPSRLSQLLEDGPLTPDERARAKALMVRLISSKLTKYNDFSDRPWAESGYILIVDQVQGDASIAGGGADAERFSAMLEAARAAHPGKPILLRRHPRAALSPHLTHFRTVPSGVTLAPSNVNPWDLVSGADAVHCVTSQLGFETILFGKRPVLHGRPFYGGLGLSEEATGWSRGTIDRETLFHRAMIDLPIWFDPFAGEICSPERAADILEDRTIGMRRLTGIDAAGGIRLWKRAHVKRFLGVAGETSVKSAISRAKSGTVAIWASQETEADRTLAADLVTSVLRIEDGFIRSQGIGAALIPPLSLAVDRQGIYFDPARPSDLEDLIRAGAPDGGTRARNLIEILLRSGVTKYARGGEPLTKPPGHVILVPGQVEDDASIRLGADEIRTNAALLQAVRAANPTAVIIYKPHPDVEAGLRPGQLSPDIEALADTIWSDVAAADALDAVDAVWTMTSLIGFEALMRRRHVVCFGQPFFAGWGLTEDRGEVPDRRGVPRSLEDLVDAALIRYPVYRDPVTGLICGVEDVVARLAHGGPLTGQRPMPILSKLQGVMAPLSGLWR